MQRTCKHLNLVIKKLVLVLVSWETRKGGGELNQY